MSRTTTPSLSAAGWADVAEVERISAEIRTAGPGQRMRPDGAIVDQAGKLVGHRDGMRGMLSVHDGNSR